MSMTNSVSLSALAGLADVPPVVVVASFMLWPYHIAAAMGAMDSALTLSGYGAAAVVLQTVALLAFFGAAPVVFRSRQIKRIIKITYLPAGYPVIVGLTNILPALL